MADKKVSELSAITNLSGDDLLLVVNDPSGTPTSNKVTVTNLFANVVPNVVHKGTVTARGNTTFSGTTMTVSSNATFSGTLTVTGSLVESGLTTHGGVQIYGGNTIFNDTMFANGGLVISSSVSSGGSNIIGKNGNLNANNAIASGTITDAMLATNIDKYIEKANTSVFMEVANTNTLVNDRLQIANAQVYLEVSNATAQFANSADPILTGSATAETLSVNFNLASNTVTINSNTGLVVAGGGLTDQVPATSNASTEGISAGTIWYSNNHLYIAVDDSTIKRVNLSTF